MRPFRRCGLTSDVEINTFMFRFTLSTGFSRGVGLLSGWPFLLMSGLWLSCQSCFFVCCGLTSLLNIWGRITMVLACSSGTLRNVLPHRNAMPQTQDMTPHPITVYRHRADLLLCYPLIWKVTLEYTATHFNVLGKNQHGNLSRPSTHTSKQSTS